MKSPGIGPQVPRSMLPFTRDRCWVRIFDPRPSGAVVKKTCADSGQYSAYPI